MLDRITSTLQFDGEALALRAQRQQVLASNIANADTPNYQARDFDFGQALARASAHVGVVPAGAGTVLSSSGAVHSVTPASSDAGDAQSRKGFLPIAGTGASAQPAMLWRTPQQPSIDRNTVDLDRERANFADNSLRYEATLRFVNGKVRNMLSAIRGD
ncbi:MAG: flagellar basal body rod protein FlgB [Burkholderiaceae bacterium]|nr:flagellar basal body rod protein FlgB [Burkholderiaceae bacterium]